MGKLYDFGNLNNNNDLKMTIDLNCSLKKGLSIMGISQKHENFRYNTYWRFDFFNGWNSEVHLIKSLFNE